MHKTLWPSCAAAVACLVACSPEDLAALETSMEHAPLTELSHVVSVRLDRGMARLTVNRQVRNETNSFQSLTHQLKLPEEAVATSLRVGVDGRWQQRPPLLGAEEVSARWDELRGLGEARPATLALLQWGSSGLDLELFAVPPRATVEVEYVLELSTRYVGGALQLDYPRDDEGGWNAPPQFHLDGATSTTIEDLIDESNYAPVALRVRQRWSPQDLVDVRWATYSVGTERALHRLEVDVVEQLERAPVRPNVVFVVDASHSEGAEGITAQLELLAPYLENAPDAQVEVVLYRRFAQRLFGRFVPAGDVARLLAAAPAETLAPGNGSNLEAGAALAAEAFAQVGGTGRMVLFTDEHLRAGFSNQLALDALATAPRDAIVHVVGRDAQSAGEVREWRDDDNALSPIAAAHGGVFFRVRGRTAESTAAPKTLLTLVRPTRIDSLTVEATGFPERELAVPGTLAEGETLRVTDLDAFASASVTLTGKIWARDFRRVVNTDAQLGERLPGLAVGLEAVRSQLTDGELRTAAFAARAVSPLTSYLSVPAEAAPSSAGVAQALDRLQLDGFSTVTSCCGATACRFGRGRHIIDYVELLRALLVPGVAVCAQRYGDVSMSTVRIEATRDEVVAVNVSASTTGLTECLTEAAWAIRLTAEFAGHTTYSVALR